MKESEISFQKRAVYTGLQPYLSEDQLMDALILWESHYGKESRFSLRYYVNDLANLLNRKSELKLFLLSLAASMVKAEKELLPDPSKKLETYKKNNHLTLMSHYTVSEIEAFQVLVNKWISMEASGVAIDILRFVGANIDRLGIDKALMEQIRLWLYDETHSIQVISVKTSDLRKVINLYYIASCEYRGPVETDAQLANAITKLKSNGGAKYSELFAKFL